MRIFAVIVTYNALKWIDKCLDCLSKSTIPLTPIIVDNNSSDNTVEHIKRDFPNILILEQDKNLGFGKANNLGIRHAVDNNADYILLLNQDAYLAPDAIQLMLETSDGESLVSPVHLNGKGTAVDRMFNWELHQAVRSGIYDDVFTNRSLKNRYEIGYVCAACWFLPINVIKKIGGFNPLFFHYGEDDNFYQRLSFHKIKVYLSPLAHVCHDRELYGNINTFNKKKLHRDILLKICDINKPFAKAVFSCLHILYTCYMYDLWKKSYRIGGFLNETIWLCLNARKVMRHRNADKKGGLNWI